MAWWNPISWFEDKATDVMQDMFVHMILPLILFGMAFLTLVFGRLPAVLRIVLAIAFAAAGAYLMGWFSSWSG